MRQKHNLCRVWSRRHWKSIVLHVFKQTWQWNYHSMNVSGYRSVIGKWRILLKFDDYRGLNLVHQFGIISNKANKFEVEGTVQDVLKGRCGRKRSSTDNRVLMQSCRFLHDPQRSHWGNILVRLVSRNPVFMECCELKMEALHSETCPRSTSLLGVYCGRRWIFWTCTCLRKFKE